MRGLTKKFIVLLVLGGLFSYLVLPGLIENQLAQRLQVAFGAPAKPVVEVSSSFPPEMLLGRIDRIQVSADQMSLQGVALYNVQADLRGVNVSVPSLLEGNPVIEPQSCSLSVEAPAILINQDQACLSYLGLGPVW
jgi:LmeA-like phospholipid-binding